MELGQSAGIAAAKAINKNSSVQKIKVEMLQKSLRENPYLNNAKPDILIRMKDSSLYKMTGDWVIRKEIGFDYTEPYIFSAGGQWIRRIIFQLPVKQEGVYDVYLHSPWHDDIKEANLKIDVTVQDKKTTRVINLDKVSQVNGRMWSLGRYQLNPNDNNFIEVIGDNIDVPIQVGSLLIVPTKD